MTAFALDALRAASTTVSPVSPSRNDRVYLQQVGLRVRVLRAAQQLTQDKLADLAGLDRTYVSRLERGQHNLTVLTLARLAQALGIPTKELLP